MGLRVFRTIRELRQWRTTLKDRVGLVPTMGALHEGHRSLLDAARSECGVVSVTIFVNPTQFAPHEDLGKYPRTWDADLDVLQKSGVDAVFAPDVAELYPTTAKAFTVAPPPTFLELPEAKARPGHFAGVATVCLKLFNLVKPDVAFFGQKDALQCAALRAMVRDFDLDLDLRVCPTARDPDGLALSSRNAYLDADARRAAPVVFRALSAARDHFRRGSSGSAVVLARDLVHIIRGTLGAEPAVDHVDYVSVADFDTMADFAGAAEITADTLALLSVAVRLGGVRLIDNLPLTLE